MSTLDQIAHFQNRRDEAPNVDLARRLAETKDRKGIREIAAGLKHANAQVRNDCIKVLYEIGYLNPRLVAGYTGDFLTLLKSRDNRMVWGAMTALSTVAAVQAGEIAGRLDEVLAAMDAGSVITRDNGIAVLALVAAQGPAYGKRVFPHLLRHLETCRPKDVPQHAEKILPAANAGNLQAFLQVLDKRMTDLSSAQSARVRKVVREATIRGTRKRKA